MVKEKLLEIKHLEQVLLLRRVTMLGDIGRFSAFPKLVSCVGVGAGCCGGVYLIHSNIIIHRSCDK